jgi:4-amino-4-deoxy-L-arabinose transferase-like glycosyltransferase
MNMQTIEGTRQESLEGAARDDVRTRAALNSWRDFLQEPTAVWLCVTIALGGFLRLYCLDFQSLWHDEGIQYYVATQNSISELFHQTRSFHPPLSFIVNHLFLLIGESDFFLRLPSALFGIASLPVLYILARDLTSRQGAFFAVSVFAVSPFHVWYSQDGRMYSQLLFLSLLSSVLLMQALKHDKPRWWVFYTLVSTAGLYTHVFMALGLIAQFLWVLFYERRHLPAMTASGVTVALLFLPWMLLLPWVSRFMRGLSSVGASAVSSMPDARVGFSWAVVPYTFFVYAVGFSLGPTVAELHADRSPEFIVSFLPSISLGIPVFATLLATGIFVVTKRFGVRASGFSLLGLCLPVAGAVAYSLAPRATYNVRYTIVAFPYFCLFAGTALAYIVCTNKVLGTAVVLAVIGISSASLYNHFANPRYAKEDVRSAAMFWRQAGAKEPLLAVGSSYAARRYLSSEEAKGVFFVGKDVVSSIEQILSTQNASSAYVVLARDWNRTRETAIQNAFATTLERSFPGVKVFRISRLETVGISSASPKPAPSRQP